MSARAGKVGCQAGKVAWQVAEVSTSTIVARAKETGHHVVKIDGYSQTKAMVATGYHLDSCVFLVGGRSWRVIYYPNGLNEEHANWIALTLKVEVDAAAAAVKAQFRFSLLDQAGEPVPAYSAISGIQDFPSPAGSSWWGFRCFLRRDDLEKSEHLKDDCFAVRCDIDIMDGLDLRVEETFLDVPESDLHAHLGRLLDAKDGADVVFKVGEEMFAAHRCVLAARSPVLKAELFGSTTKHPGRYVKIDDIGPGTFRALLHFMYTDTLPEMAVQDVPAMARQLLAAADRYQVERLKLICEDKLNKHLEKSTTVTDSAAADHCQQEQHRHQWFTEMCLKFVNFVCPSGQRQQYSPSTLPTVKKVDDSTPSPAASTIIVSEASGHHVLKVEGYLRTKMMVVTGDHVSSGEFHVGGQTWRIRYYPNGYVSDSRDFISIYVECTGTAAAIDVVHARLKLSLLDHAGEAVPLYSSNFAKCTFTKRNLYGHDRFINRRDLENSEHLKDDCFAVRCDLTVFIEELRLERHVTVPPPVLSRHLRQLLSSKEGADVTFKVGRETFAAHRCVLAARSPVFKAELLGPMREHTTRCIRIDDMNVAAFRALLYFIYTDEMPTVSKEEVTAMAQHLLVAADRYSMERLKAVCEDKLCRHLDGVSAATTLTLAEQHHCPRLKEAIFGFLCSPANLRAAVASDGYEHLTTSCPSITKELIAKLAAAL